MWKIIEIASYIVLPIVWALALEYAFRLITARRSRQKQQEAAAEDDWVI